MKNNPASRQGCRISQPDFIAFSGNQMPLYMKAEVKKLIDQLVQDIHLSKTEEERKANDALLERAMGLTVTDEEKKAAGQYLREAMKRRRRNDVDAKGLLGEMTDAVSLSYIARTYFGKDKSWLYQRLNNTLVNGKPAAFTQQELKTLADSIGDLSKRLSAISTIIHQKAV